MKSIKDGEIYGDDGAGALECMFVTIGKEKFPAWKILREVDLDGGASTNFGTVDVLRKMEDLPKYKRGMFPSSSTIGNRASALEKFADKYVPFVESVSEDGNLQIVFDYESVLRCALTALGLLEKAVAGGVELVFTLDYAQYCKKRGHILAGCKIVDREARSPVDGGFLMADGENAQANEELTCIPLHFVNAKESYKVFNNELKPFFDFGKKCLVEGLPARGADEVSLVPFRNCAFPMDMSAEQKCLNVGGGARLQRDFVPSVPVGLQSWLISGSRGVRRGIVESVKSWVWGMIMLHISVGTIRSMMWRRFKESVPLYQGNWGWISCTWKRLKMLRSIPRCCMTHHLKTRKQMCITLILIHRLHHLN